MTFPPIRKLVPHADPMVLLDQVITADAESLTAQLIIHRGSLFFDGQQQAVAAWVGIEYMAQTIAAYAGYQALQQGEAVKVGFLLGTRRYESHCAYFACGSVLHIRVQRILQNENGLGAFECQIEDIRAHERVLLATANVTVFQPDNVNQFLGKKP